MNIIAILSLVIYQLESAGKRPLHFHICISYVIEILVFTRTYISFFILYPFILVLVGLAHNDTSCVSATSGMYMY